MKKGFTITELMVAVGLLAAVLSASMVVFTYSIEAQRTAMATAEIMRTLRSITDQLNYDFSGIAESNQAPMITMFEGSDPNADSIVFFATGDFQDANGTIRGNVARVYYGQAEYPDPLSSNADVRKTKILTRKQVILAPDQTGSGTEYESDSLVEQLIKYRNKDTSVSDWYQRPDVNSSDTSTIPMYLAKGVDNFTIMYCHDYNDIECIDANGAINWQRTSGETKFFGLYGNKFVSYPKSIKFTFTLYDSKGILKGGRRFEHIVYIRR